MSIPLKKRLLCESGKEKAKVSIINAIVRWTSSVLLVFPGFPISRVPFGKYIYSLGGIS